MPKKKIGLNWAQIHPQTIEFTSTSFSNESCLKPVLVFNSDAQTNVYFFFFFPYQKYFFIGFFDIYSFETILGITENMEGICSK